MKYRVFVAVVLLLTMALSASGCEDTKFSEQRDESINARVDTMARAEALVPAPYTENFPLRAVLAEYTRRQDLPNHPWYTYIMSDNGTITHYFVSTAMPVSTNAFLGSTESVYDGTDSDLVLTAPSLDGIYYGGSGSTSSLNGWIFIDAATGAMGIAYGQKILTFDAPLILETEPLLIQAQEAPSGE